MPQKPLVPQPYPPKIKIAGKKRDKNRTSDAAIFVRLTSDQRQHIELAIQRQLDEAGIPGAKLTIGKWLVNVGMVAANKILGAPREA
jgi:hypothetical protein